MPPTDYEAMLQNTSYRMATSQFLRRLSAHSSSTATSCSSRKASARVSKQSSAGNSPSYVQRRRTTASYSTRSYPHLSQENEYQTQEQRQRKAYNSREIVPIQRPMSWHPGSDDLHRPATQVPTSEPALGNTIAGLQNLAVSSTPASSVQQSIKNAFAMGYGYPISKPPAVYDRSSKDFEIKAVPQSVYDPYSVYSIPGQHEYPYVSAPTCDMYQPSEYQIPQWPHVQSETVYAPQTFQEAPDFVSIQAPSSVPQKLDVRMSTQVSKKKSKELKGLGLYDNENHEFMSTLVSAANQDLNRESMGKGLKLEETWQPPMDDDGNNDDEDEEGYSTDEIEEVDEVPPITASTPAKPQTAFYSSYDDLSNQSFLFNDDDQFQTEDQYVSYLAFGQELPETQSKQQQAGTGNFLWV